MQEQIARTSSFPPGPRSRFPGGTLLVFRKDPLAFMVNLARDYGDIAHFKLSVQDVFLINNPDWIRDVLVTNNRNFVKSRGLEVAKRFLGEGLLTSEHEFHFRQRRLVQPAFHRQRLAGYANVMADYAAQIRDQWTEGQTVDISREMMRLTMRIVGKTLFDADLEADANDIRDSLTEIMNVFTFSLTLPFAQFIEKLFVARQRRFQAARARLDAVIYGLIRERRSSGVDAGDLLSMLMMSTDEEGDGDGMSDVQIRDEAMTLFLAGHETTANALSWAWYLLALNPDAEARMHAEVDVVLHGRTPSMEDLPNLTYTEMVLAESMRMFPPAWTLGRRALADYPIDGYVVPAGAIILMSQFVTQHDPRYFPDPYKFEPERWTPELRDARPKFSYFPFGGGPRVCIGEQFAWMEGVLLLATFAQKWRLGLVAGHAVTPQPLITLRPKNGILARVEAR